MKATYDPEADALTLVFRRGPVEESDEIRDGVIIDYGKDGRILALELLDASDSIRHPDRFAAAVEAATRTGGVVQASPRATKRRTLAAGRKRRAAVRRTRSAPGSARKKS